MFCRSTTYSVRACVLGVLMAASGLLSSATALADDGVHRAAPALQRSAQPSESPAAIHREARPKVDGKGRARPDATPKKPAPSLKAKKKPQKDGIPEFSMEIPRNTGK